MAWDSGTQFPLQGELETSAASLISQKNTQATKYGGLAAAKGITAVVMLVGISSLFYLRAF